MVLPPCLGASAVNDTVRAETITEFIQEKAGPVIFKTALPELKAFRHLSCKKSKAWKLLETITNSREGLSRNKEVKFKMLIPGNMFPDTLLLWSQQYNESCTSGKPPRSCWMLPANLVMSVSSLNTGPARNDFNSKQERARRERQSEPRRSPSQTPLCGHRRAPLGRWSSCQGNLENKYRIRVGA